MLDKKRLARIFQKNAPLLYKLSSDSLLILVFFFVLVLMAEGLLPGIISARIGLYKIVIILSANILVTLTLKNFYLPQTPAAPNRKILWSAFGLALILIFNALFTLSIYLNLFILALSGVTIFYIFQVFQEEE